MRTLDNQHIKALRIFEKGHGKIPVGTEISQVFETDIFTVSQERWEREVINEKNTDKNYIQFF